MCYVSIVLVMPFYFENGYFNMTEAKARFLWIAGEILFLAILASYIPGMASKIFNHSQSDVSKGILKQKIEKRFSILDISILLFLCSVICSGFISKTPREAFWGSSGWFMGILTIGILVLMYFAISRNIEFGRYMIITVIVSSTMLYVMGILNSFHIDVFGLHQRISNDFYNYISTIGNVNWYVGYLSMIFPMGCILYLGCKRLPMKLLLLIFANLGYYNVIICKSDGIILGLAASFFVIGLYIIRHREYLENFLLLTISFCITTGIVFGIIEFYQGQYVKIDSMFLFVLEKKLWLFFGIVALLFLWLLKRKKRNIKRENKQKPYFGIIFCIFFIVVGFALLMYEISAFDDSWGTKRGVLWIYTYNLFSKFQWKYKLFGCGCDCFGIAFLSRYFNYVKGIYLNAHNEFLQYLITTGIFGLISYSMIWISSINMFFKKKEKFIRDWMLFSGIMGYLGQSVVNNPQAFNYAVLFLILALFQKSWIEGNVRIKENNSD